MRTNSAWCLIILVIGLLLTFAAARIPAWAESLAPHRLRRMVTGFGKERIMKASRLSIVLGILVVSLLLVGGGVLALGPPGPDAPTATWRLQGMVFEGTPPGEETVLTGVTVDLYRSNTPYPAIGAYLRSAITNESGWYGIDVYDDDLMGWEYVYLLVNPPPGYTPNGVSSVSGTEYDPDRIEFALPLPPSPVTGNKFWLRPVAGTLQGAVLDAELANTAPPCAQPIEVEVSPGNLTLTADPSTGDYGPVQLAGGQYLLTASAPGFMSQSAWVTIIDNVTTVQDFGLWRPILAVDPPDFISRTAIINQQTVFLLAFSNDGHAPLSVEFELEVGELPGNLWVDPVTATLPALVTGQLDVIMQCTEIGDAVGTLIVNHNAPCQGPVEIPLVIHCQEEPAPEWTKLVNGEPWHPDLVVTAETADTIEVIDVYRPADELTLEQTWNPDHLQLVDSWQEQVGDVITETSLFHVNPCTWTETIVTERLLWPDGSPLDEKPFIVHKTPPDLWIDSSYDAAVYPGALAAFTLAYGNLGGFEPDVLIVNEFPPAAPFVRSYPTPTLVAPDNLTVWWEVGSLENGAVDEIDVYVSIDGSLTPSTTVSIWGGIFDHAGQLVQFVETSFHVETPPPVPWDKFVDGIPWEPGLVWTKETSDTVWVEDVIHPSGLPVTLVEEWDPNHLDLASWEILPYAVGQVTELPGLLVWEVPPDIGEPFALVLAFHVEPCLWGHTVLQELLFVEGTPEPLSRPVIIEKWGPDLWIDSFYDVFVEVGQPATFILTYGNHGGREFGALIRNEFTPDAPFIESAPPPDRTDPGGLWAEWDLPVLENGAMMEIEVTVDIPPWLPPLAGISIWDGIFNHAGEQVDHTVIEFLVPEPPIVFPGGDWPWYAQGEIGVSPEPPIARQPTQICVDVVNSDPENPHEVVVEIGVAHFGIGIPFTPIGHVPLTVAAGHMDQACVVWVPPTPNHWCIQARLLQEGEATLISQRNVDVDEPLRPFTPHLRAFPVRNPFSEPVTVTLALTPHLPGWGLALSQEVLPNLPAGAIEMVTLTVVPPAVLPADGSPIVDIEAYVGEDMIGGFRKIFRPPVILHHFADPFYAERELTIHPYPPRAFEPTELCVELRNPTNLPQDAWVQFSWAKLGIGLPFTPINGLRAVHLPPYSVVRECLHWVPPTGGQFCLQVELLMEGYPTQVSRLNLDANEPLRPLTPHAFSFPVGNPFPEPVTINLGLIPHFPDWGLELSRDLLIDLPPGLTETITLTVTPPADLPLDGDPVVDIEAYVGGELLGGIRKIYRPPVPIHRPQDPVYAESEIGIDPYPVLPGMPTKLSVELFNPTDSDHVVTATFSVAPFGIGLPFSTAGITPNPIRLFVPALGAARGHVVWTPPPELHGKVCVQVTVELPGHAPVWSQRNIDVGEPLRPRVPHSLDFAVGIGEQAGPLTVTMGLIRHKPGWDISLSAFELPAVQTGESITVTLTVTPPMGAKLGTGEPIVDVEAYAGGTLIGGFRKLDIPPVPLHKPHEKRYAETELSVDPYPPVVGVPSTVAALLQNGSQVPATVNLSFGWATFGFGIPFTSTGMAPPTRTLTLMPGMTGTATVAWTPTTSGHQCLLVEVTDPAGVYERQWSQRNVDVEERPPCAVTQVYSFTVYNGSAVAVTVDLGLITFNVPSDWQVTTNPSGSVAIEPFGELAVIVLVTIPCPRNADAVEAGRLVDQIQQGSNSVPTVDVEGYIDNAFVGGIELQFPLLAPPLYEIYLPLVMRGDLSAAGDMEFLGELLLALAPGSLARYLWLPTHVSTPVSR